GTKANQFAAIAKTPGSSSAAQPSVYFARPVVFGTELSRTAPRKSKEFGAGGPAWPRKYGKICPMASRNADLARDGASSWDPTAATGSNRGDDVVTKCGAAVGLAPGAANGSPPVEGGWPPNRASDLE